MQKETKCRWLVFIRYIGRSKPDYGVCITKPCAFREACSQIDKLKDCHYFECDVPYVWKLTPLLAASKEMADEAARYMAMLPEEK